MGSEAADQRKGGWMKLDMIGFDADDTLWKNEIYYRNGRQLFDRLMKKYGVSSEGSANVERREIENLQYYGYGAVGFAISMAEAAVELTKGEITASELMQLVGVAKKIISAEVELLDGATEVVSHLAEATPLLLITKGDLLHQQSKVDHSGLKEYFSGVEIVSDKTPETYQAILDRRQIDPIRFLMIGNSMRSDVLPVLDIGAMAVHLSGHMTWDFEQEEELSLPEGRFFEVESIAEIPQLIDDIRSAGE
jgi:putative hydrolase of the HAD superfamily